MIEQTLIARCDSAKVIERNGRDVATRCGRAEILNPHTTQRWLALTDRGWALDHRGEDTKTFCPDHDDEASAPLEEA